jgi:hypothetical protein
MDIRVNLVYRVHPELGAHDPVLHRELDTDTESALKVQDLDTVAPGDGSGLLLQREGGYSSSNLVNLAKQTQSGKCPKVSLDHTHPVRQQPVPHLHQERKVCEEPRRDGRPKADSARHTCLPLEEGEVSI